MPQNARKGNDVAEYRFHLSKLYAPTAAYSFHLLNLYAPTAAYSFHLPNLYAPTAAYSFRLPNLYAPIKDRLIPNTITLSIKKRPNFFEKEGIRTLYYKICQD